jgi:hypothetical protein
LLDDVERRVSPCPEPEDHHPRQGGLAQEERRQDASVSRRDLISSLRSHIPRSWSTRYFALIGSALTYKLKQDSTSLRGTFDLVPGCILTEVEEDKGSKKGKKLYSFWIVWPEVDEKKAEGEEPDSDGDDEKEELAPSKTKDLKQVSCAV